MLTQECKISEGQFADIHAINMKKKKKKDSNNNYSLINYKS